MGKDKDKEEGNINRWLSKYKPSRIHQVVHLKDCEKNNIKKWDYEVYFKGEF